MKWYLILFFVVAIILLFFVLSLLFYKSFFKRFYDILLSSLAILILTPIFLFFIIFGAIKMKGNPFFTQERPGKKGKIFKLIKFRSMTCEKDQNGVLLADDKRITKYGEFIREHSIDELPEIFNIFIGDMSIVGPRPLLTKYLERYNDEQKQRHCVRPGLTGYAQINGRNAISWDQKFKLDVYYVDNVSFIFDIKICFITFLKVLKKDGINCSDNTTMEEFMGSSKDL